MKAPAPPLHAAGIIDADVRCLRCGYNLRGLGPGMRCPESGAPAAKSLLGNLLRHSDPGHVRGLARGATLIQVSIVFIALAIAGQLAWVFAAQWLRMAPPSAPLMSLISNSAAGLGLIGGWLYSRRDPAYSGNDPSDTSRRALRTVLWVNLVAGIVDLLAQLYAADAPGGPIAAVWAAGIFAVARF